MPKYLPRPDKLDNLNILQRYMQKDGLDTQDYAYLFIFVLAYFSLRPYIQKFFKWAMAPKELQEGEAAQREYFESKQSKAKIGANSIRGSDKTGEMEEPVEVGDGRSGNDVAAATGSSVGGMKGSAKDGSGKAVNRKQKGVSFAAEKTEEEKLLDWDDEPLQQVEQGEKGNIMQWLDKWDK